MQKVLFMQGLPGSGKSTLAKKIQITQVGRPEGSWVILSLDKFREAIQQDWSDVKEAIVKDVYYTAIKEVIENGYNVILDNTHLKTRAITDVMYRINDMGRPIEYYYYTMDTPLEECLKRNSERTGHKRVPDEVIYRMERQPINDYLQTNAEPFVFDEKDYDTTVAWLKEREERLTHG